MVTRILLDVIQSPEMKQRLSDLNQYFYNRKHETQIRDEISILINKLPSFHAITEYPKSGVGAVDLTVNHAQKDKLHPVGTIEFKHQYPKDFRYGPVNNAIISDLLKEVDRPTSHFVLIVQHRAGKAVPILGMAKYMDRNVPLENVAQEVARLENLPTFSEKAILKDKVEVAVSGELLDSTYIFMIYEVRNLNSAT